MQNYAVAHVSSASGAANASRMLKRYGPTEEGYVSAITLTLLVSHIVAVTTHSTTHARLIDTVHQHRRKVQTHIRCGPHRPNGPRWRRCT
jgi:hypothetical protein